MAEAEVQKGIDRGLDAVILNPANIIGAYDSLNRFACSKWWLRTGYLACRRAAAHCSATRRQVARAHIAAVYRGRTGERYSLGGADASYLEVAQSIASLLGKRTKLRRFPAMLVVAAARAALLLSLWNDREPLITPEIAAFMSRDVLCRSEKAIRELGYHPTPLHIMLEDCYGWLKAEKLI